MSVSPAQFAEAVLVRLKGPNGEAIHATANNVNAFLAWMAFEGGHWHNAAKYNPLNTTQAMPGSYKAPGTIVQAYPDWKTGLDATVKTISYGAYAGIRTAFAANADPSVTAQAIKTSPWGTTALPTNAAQLAALTMRMRGEKASSGSLGFPWIGAGAVLLGAGAGAALGFGALTGAAAAAIGYGAATLIRRI
jgi:hypothetical protein